MSAQGAAAKSKRVSLKIMVEAGRFELPRAHVSHGFSGRRVYRFRHASNSLFPRSFRITSIACPNRLVDAIGSVRTHCPSSVFRHNRDWIDRPADRICSRSLSLLSEHCDGTGRHECSVRYRSDHETTICVVIQPGERWWSGLLAEQIECSNSRVAPQNG